MSLEGPSAPNPFVEVEVWGEFRHREVVRRVRGFYDGKGTYRVRFMPDEIGEWTYAVSSTGADHIELRPDVLYYVIER